MSISMPSQDPAIYDPDDPAIRANPFPVYKRLRDEDPVHWSPALKAWIITRYEDVRKVALDADMSPDRLTPFYEKLPEAQKTTLSEVMRYLNLWLVFRDPPEHTRLRRLLGTAFTPRALEALRPNIREISDMLLDRLEGRTRIDIVSDFAMQVPAMVIMDMLGVPRDRLWDMKAWSDDMVSFIGSARNVPDKYERARHGAEKMSAFFRAVIAEHRQTPKDDFISALIAARDQESDDGEARLSEDELVASCMLILFGGHETTNNLISNSIHILLTHPEQREMLRADPSLIGSAVEEFLRYDGPSNSIARVVAKPHGLHGVEMKQGDRVFIMLNAANRDPRQFDRPDELDLTRDPNRHVTFGSGIHFCLGAPLARLEGQIAIPALIERFPDMRLVDDDPPEWLDALIMRGLLRLPVDLA